MHQLRPLSHHNDQTSQDDDDDDEHDTTPLPTLSLRDRAMIRAVSYLGSDFFPRFGHWLARSPYWPGTLPLFRHPIHSLRTIPGRVLASDVNVNEATFQSILAPPTLPSRSQFTVPQARVDATPGLFSWATLMGSGSSSGSSSSTHAPVLLGAPRLRIGLVVSAGGDVELVVVV